jgi:hypothetical protein
VPVNPAVAVGDAISSLSGVPPTGPVLAGATPAPPPPPSPSATPRPR